MIVKKITLMLIIFANLFFNELIIAQKQETIDSLLNSLNNTTIDTCKVNILNKLCIEYKDLDLKKALEYANQAFQMAEKYSYKKGIASSCLMLGNLFSNMGKYDKSNEYFQKSLKMFKELDDKEGISDCMSGFGFVYRKQGNFQKSIENYQESLRVIEGLGLKSRVASCLNNVAIVYSIQGDYVKGSEYFQKSLEIREEIGDKKGVSTALVNIGNIHIYLGNYSKAIESFQKALNIKKEFGDKRGTSNCFHNLGALYRDQSYYDKAFEYFQKSLEIDKELDDRSGIAGVYYNIGQIYKEKGIYLKAIEYYQKSLKISEELGEKDAVLDCIESLGIVYNRQGNFYKAIEYFQKSLKIGEELGQRLKVSNSYTNFGIAYQLKGNFSLAIEYYQKSLKIKEEFDEKKNLSDCLNNLGIVYLEEGIDSLAFKYLLKSLKIKEEINHKSGIVSCLNNIGFLYLKQKQYPKAIEYFDKSIKKGMEIGVIPEIVLNYNNLGRLYSEQHEYKKALNNYQLALMANIDEFHDTIIYNNPKELRAFDKKRLLETLGSKAELFYNIYIETNSLKDLEVAISTYELLFKLIHEMRNEYTYENTQFLLSENTKSYSTKALFAALNLVQYKFNIETHNKFFEYIEKSKSTSLSNYLYEKGIKKYFGINESLIEREKEIALNRRFYETNIQKLKAQKEAYDTLLIQDYQDKLFFYSRQYDSLLVTIKYQYPEYYQLKYQQNVASSKDLQKEMGVNEAMLNYFISDTSLFIAGITKDTIVYKMIKVDSLFDQQIIDYHIDIKTVFGNKELISSSKLYSYFIEPIENIIKDKNRLIIIPDGNLYYVPFETLCKNSKSDNSTTPDFLIKKYAISYNHSATIWSYGKEKTKKGNIVSNNFIGFAPVFDPKVKNGSILSTEWISDTTNIEMASRSISSDLKHLNYLPNTEKEIKSILQLFKKHGKNGLGYFHREASEENFKSKILDYEYIHVASHSFANDNYPNLSGIAFSQPDTTLLQNDRTEDGILYAGETYNLDLSKAKLVVLSSCKSGLGKLINGEGFLSLSRGFLYSGVQNIVFSLWNVNDEATKDLMIAFYKEILTGSKYAEALQKAKLQLINNKKTLDPKYWAAWVLVGE